MNEKNNRIHYLSIKELLSESLLRDIILFTFLFILIIFQQWDYIFLLLFPLITLCLGVEAYGNKYASLFISLPGPI